MFDRKKIRIPSGTTLHGRSDRGFMHVSGAGKPPKLRWQPGSFVRVRGMIYEVMYAYRIESNPHEWMFSLEERQTLSSAPPDEIGRMIQALGAGSTTPRIVYEIFRDSYAAMTFFSDIPLNGNRWEVTNKMLIQEGQLLSSGEVISK